MSVANTIMGLISFGVIVLGLLIIEVVFGPVINAFASIATTFDSGADPFWVSQVLPNFAWFHNAPLIIIVAVAVWVLLKLIFNTVYTREDTRGYR